MYTAAQTSAWRRSGCCGLHPYPAPARCALVPFNGIEIDCVHLCIEHAAVRHHACQYVYSRNSSQYNLLLGLHALLAVKSLVSVKPVRQSVQPYKLRAEITARVAARSIQCTLSSVSPVHHGPHSSARVRASGVSNATSPNVACTQAHAEVVPSGRGTAQSRNAQRRLMAWLEVFDTEAPVLELTEVWRIIQEDRHGARVLPRGLAEPLAAALTVLAQAAADAPAPAPRGQEPVRGAHALGKAAGAAPALGAALAARQDFAAAADALFAAVSQDRRTYGAAAAMSQAAAAQAALSRGCTAFWARLHAERRVQRMDLRGASGALWARARLVEDGALPPPSQEELDHLASFILVGDAAARLNGFDVANSMWALGTVGTAAPPGVLSVLMQAAERTAREMAAQGLASTLVGLARIKAAGMLGQEGDVGEGLREALLRAAAAGAPRMGGQEASTSLWALGTLHWGADAAGDASIAAVGALSASVVAKGHRASASGAGTSAVEPIDVVTALVGLAHLRAEVPPATQHALLRAVAVAAPSMSPQLVANTVWALGWVGAASSSSARSGAADALYDAIRRVSGELAPQPLANTLWGLSHLGIAVPADIATALLSAVKGSAESMGARDVAMTASALAALGWRIPVTTATALVAAAMHCAPRLDPRDTAALLDGLSRLSGGSGVRIPAPLCDALMAALEREAPGMNGHAQRVASASLQRLDWPVPSMLA